MKRYVTLQNIVIPAGTLFDRAANERWGADAVECIVGIWDNYAQCLNIPVSDIEEIDDGILTVLQ